MPRIYTESLRTLDRTKAAIIAPLGIILMNAYVQHEGLVHADANWDKRIETAFPSALVAPQVSDDLGYPSHNLDIAIASGEVTAATGAALLTGSRPGELVAIGVGAQVAATAADGFVDHAQLLSRQEAHGMDVGPSAIVGAFFMKAIADQWWKADKSKSKQAWAAAGAGLASIMTAASYYFDRKNGTLDLASHTAGMAVGALASCIKNRRKYPASSQQTTA